MRNLLFIASLILVFDFLFFECANPKAPTGGPRDSIPPTLIRTIPPQGTVQFTGTEIILEFDERIAVDKLQTNLIITPQVDIKYKSIVKKNSLYLQFEEPFPDSTTMTLNFFDGVTDITENNPALNLSYVFSTGDYLDSLSVSGTVISLMKYEPQKEYLVGLYPISDSLDFFSQKPYYFTSSLESGTFRISNIKNGPYRILAFKDDNRNLLFDPTLEPYGFLSDTLQLDSSLINIELRTLKQNVSELQLISSRINGRYFDARYSKGLDSVSVSPYSPHNFLSESNTLRFYRPDNLNLSDSLEVIIQSFDSLRNDRIDTLFIKFQESARKPAPFDYQLIPNAKNLDLSSTFNIQFTKPILSIDTSKIFYSLDSINSIPVDTTASLNLNRSKLLWTQEFDTSYINRIYRNQRISIDSSATDTTQLVNQDAPTDIRQKRKPTKTSSKGITFKALKGAFISIDNDTLPNFEKAYSFHQKSDNGKLIINIDTSSPSFFVELIDNQFKTLKTYPGSSLLELTLPAGEYGIRILVDDNEDGHWSKGSLIDDRVPESVILYPDFTSLRANWDVNIDIQF